MGIWVNMKKFKKPAIHSGIVTIQNKKPSANYTRRQIWSGILTVEKLIVKTALSA